MGYCTSLYDVLSDSFHNGHSIETCKEKCEENENCFAFEFDFAAGSCGINQRSWSKEAEALQRAQLDPGENGDAPWYVVANGGRLQCGGQPTHITCYPGNVQRHG